MKTAFKTLTVMTALLAAMTVFAAQAMAATVTNSGDTGAGSLRQAITDATAGDTIDFDNDYTITLTSGPLSIAKNLTIDGSGHTVVVSGNNTTRVFNITAGTVLIRNLTVTGGNASGGGGGIFNMGTLSLTGCTVSNNTSPSNDGGGIYNDTGGSLTVVNSTVSGNTSSSGGYGGGIFHSGTSLTITGSTISGNSASQGGGIESSKDFTLVNSTVSGNSAGNKGGGISLMMATADITDCTIFGNSTTVADAGGGISVVAMSMMNATVNLKNTVLAGNTGAGAPDNVTLLSMMATAFVNSLGNNLSNTSEFTAAGTDLLSKDLTTEIKLAALADNGGLTKTHALQTGSLAIDGGSCTSGTDQRGVARPQGSGCDIGAFELLSAPQVTSVSSTTANGSYKAGDTVSVTVTFSEAVNVVGGPPQLTLETGTTDAFVNYSSGSGTATLTFTYTVGAGHTSADLDYASTTALALNGATIKNLAGTFDAVLTLPTPGAANSLGANKAIVIDTTAPTLAQVTAVPTPGNDATPDYTFSSTEAGTITYTGDCSSVTAAAVSGNNTVTFGTLADGTHSNCQISVTDTAGNASGNLAVSSFTVDASAPTVTINQAAAQADPANSSPINFTVVFSESVTGFADADVTLSGTAGATTGTVTGSGTTYNVAVSGMTSAGTVIASIGAGIAADAAGNGNAASTSTDNTVTFTPPPASVISINRAGTNPTNAASVQFTVTFSESMSGIDTGDFALALTGTAAGTIASVSAASGTSITVTVNTITGNGTLGLNLTDNDSIVNGMSVPLGGAGAGNGSFTGQTYTLDHTAPTVVLSSAATNPTGSSPFSVTATFSESVTGFALGDIAVTNGSAGNFSGSGTTYTFDITPAADGLVTVNVAANAAADSAGNNSTVATALTRTYDHTLTAPAYGSNPAPGSTVSVGTANIGSPISKALQVSETGNATLNVTSHTLGGADPGDFSVTPATLSIADGGPAQNLTIQCTPSADGARTATLTVNHNATGSPATYTLECTGTTAPPVSAGVGIVSVTNVKATTALATGTASGTGITERGFFWWTDGGFTSGTVPAGSGAGNFSLTMSNLMPLTAYHVSSYIKVGAQLITSGNKISFTTTGPVLPTVITKPDFTVNVSEVLAKGEITDVGSSPVTIYGFVYAAHTSPTVWDMALPFTWDMTLPISQGKAFEGTIKNLAPGTYYFRAYAHNAQGTAYGEEYSFTILNPNAPAAPGNLTATAVSQTQIDLSWTDNSGNETGFRIFRNGTELTPSPKVGADITTFSDTGLTCGTAYTYIVKAMNADGDSAGTTVTVTTQACTGVSPPAAPTGLTGTPVSQTQIDLSWTDNSNNETGFRIFRNGVELTPSPKVGANVTTFSDTGLICGTAYTYEVRATNADGDSAGITGTATTQACTGVTPPAAPTGLTATAVSQNQINLSWTDNSDSETGFKIFRDGVELLPSPKAGVNATTFGDAGLACGRTYTYTVKAANADGDSAATSAISITTQACPYVPPVYYETGGGSYTPANQAPVADKLYVSDEKNKAIPVKLTGSDADAPHWFLLLLRPLIYSVVTQPAHGTLSGTAPDLIYTPDTDFVGTDSFTYRIYDGTAYSAESVVAIIVHENSHAYIGDKYELDVFCAEYQGMRYGFRLNYDPVAADPSGLYWKMDILTFGKAYSTDIKGCIPVGDDLHLNIPSAYFQGTMYQFTLNYNPLSGDAFGLYWKMDLDTLKSR